MVERAEINFTVANLSNYEMTILHSDAGEIVYRLDLNWQVRRPSPNGFYWGDLITRIYSAWQMVAYLNSIHASIQGYRKESDR